LETRPVNANVQFFTAMQSEDQSADITPVGTIVAIAGAKVPDPTYWAACDGSSILRTKYPQLFSACNTIWGSEDSDHFYLPDLRGKFLRGVYNTPTSEPGVDPDRTRRKSPQPNSGSTIGTGSVQDFATSINGVRIDVDLPTRHWMNAATATGDKAED
jgi:microcystin-dependent protein